MKSYRNKGIYFLCYGRKCTDSGDLVTRTKTPDKRSTFWVESIQK